MRRIVFGLVLSCSVGCSGAIKERIVSEAGADDGSGGSASGGATSLVEGGQAGSMGVMFTGPNGGRAGMAPTGGAAGMGSAVGPVLPACIRLDTGDCAVELGVRTQRPGADWFRYGRSLAGGSVVGDAVRFFDVHRRRHCTGPV